MAVTKEEVEMVRASLSHDDLQGLTDAEWETFAEHVATHKYFLGESIPGEVSWNDAVFSWYENVFSPIRNEVDSWEISTAFPGMSRAQLIFAISSHWYYMKERDQNYGPKDAALHYAAEFGHGLGRLYSKMFAPKVAMGQ